MDERKFENLLFVYFSVEMSSSLALFWCFPSGVFTLVYLIDLHIYHF